MKTTVFIQKSVAIVPTALLSLAMLTSYVRVLSGIYEKHQSINLF
ncbi:hypothetical protein M23134_02044 [Microscilla marina ATCC 23134]|uniref:Uncharacterized protein n=1 Tax=Microscilla marina ATCC 23134 TaxID=313606 RepID=A1ZCL3_MICM2|nr:hypothetical protein M23134_02044 [Microscilla marina ATCC 23134]